MKSPLSSFILILFAAISAYASIEPVVTYAGAGHNARFNDVKELSNGTILVAGVANDLAWIPDSVPSIQLENENLPPASGSAYCFLLQLSGDAKNILRVASLPAGVGNNIRWMRSTEVPGEVTGDLYISGQIPGGYFIGRLNGNFVNMPPSAFEWVLPVSAANGHEEFQPWDVGSDGRVVFAEGGESSASIGFLDASGSRKSLPKLRASHWNGTEFVRGVGDTLADVEYSKIILPTDNVSWNDEDLFLLQSDGNGNIRQGKWPLDIMVTQTYTDSTPVRVINGRAYGYNGYRTAGRHWLGAISVDRRNNHFYYGFNVKSIFWDASNNKEQPDFEPAVIGYDEKGNMKWWSRLYTEAKDTNDDGEIDVTYVSAPDQYIDGMDIDYSVSEESGGSVVVLARCHGNNSSNFWSGNNVAANPEASAFHNSFSGTEGNIHISWIGKLKADDGELQAASYLAGFFRKVIGGKGNWPTTPYSDPNLDGWPSHNSGWPDLTTTRTVENSTRVGPDGRVYVTGVGPRMVTTANAWQKLPKRLGNTINEGTSPWSQFARAYEPSLNTLAYSSTLMGEWTYPNDDINADPQGTSNTQLRSIFPTSGGLLVVGQHSNGSGTSASGNDIPTNEVPSWGDSSYDGISAIFAILPFSENRPSPDFVFSTNESGIAFDASTSTSTSEITDYVWDFGDGTNSNGATVDHTFPTNGKYLVSLTVSNEDGLHASTNQWVEVSNADVSPYFPKMAVNIVYSHENSSYKIGFTSDNGKSYGIQESDAQLNNWALRDETVEGTGDFIEISIPSSEVTTPSFFRILQLETPAE